MQMAQGEPRHGYRMRRHNAASNAAARNAMLAARAALDSPGIEPGDDAIAQREQVWRECGAVDRRQGELPLRGKP